MNKHRSLTRQQIVRHGPARIALMVASEFGRAASRSTHRENVLACYARAKELMGVLETIPLSLPAGRRLKPIFHRIADHQLFQEPRLEPRFVQRSCAEIAEEFNRAALQLSEHCS